MSEPQSTREIIRASIDYFSYLSEGNESLLEDGIPLQHGACDGSSEPRGAGVFTAAPEKDWPPVEDARISRLRKKFCARGGIPMLTVDAHLALLCVLQLRSECGLRGIRPSRLFGGDLISLLCARGILASVDADLDMNKAGPDSERAGSVEEIRTEFIMQCFRQLGASRSPTLYRLSSLWKYSLHDVRIMHINALLDLYLDELVDEMIPQVIL